MTFDSHYSVFEKLAYTISLEIQQLNASLIVVMVVGEVDSGEMPIILISADQADRAELFPEEFIRGYDEGGISFVVVRPWAITRAITKVLGKTPKAQIHPTRIY